MTPAGPDTRSGTPFRFDYDPGVVRFGRGCVADLADELDRQGFDRALVICGRTVGSTPAVIDPVREGLGDRLAGVFAETTPGKRLSTAFAARDALREHDAYVIVALGGGSSLDIATVTSVLSADDRDPDAVGREFAERGTITIPDGDLTPIVAIPTTLAGADLTQGAGLTATPDSGLVPSLTSGGVSSRRLVPAAVCYDPNLVATTPESILFASSMNGFDKGLESLYASTATPVTDATAMRGLQLLAPGLRDVGQHGATPDRLAPVLEGILLVQYGISRPDATTMNLVHAFGHGLTWASDIQQGAAHGIVAPHVLAFLFDRVDGRRDLLATAVGVPDPGDAETVAEAVVDEVASVRAALGLPSRLRDVDGPTRDQFPAVAEYILDDAFVANAPPDLDLTTADVEAILADAW